MATVKYKQDNQWVLTTIGGTKFDSEPIQNSMNGVTSGGLYTKFSELSSSIPSAAKQASWDAKAEVSAIPTTLAQLAEDDTHKLVTATQKTNWDNHLENTDNPHSVTALQLGAEVTTNKSTTFSAAAQTSDTLYPTTKATTDFVNSSVSQMAAHYITADASGNAFATKAALTGATTYYYNGTAFTPTEHDYAVVIADEDHNNAQTRYTYTGSIWSYQYKINDEPFTQAQMNAINSGITSTIVNTTIPGKQDIISATGAANKGVYFSANGTVSATTYEVNKDVPSDAVFTDTKNTAGSTDTSSKIYLVGAASQDTNPQTYSDDEIYATNGVLTAKMFDGPLSYTTTAPTANNANGIRIAVLSSEPATKYSGWLYIVTG